MAPKIKLQRVGTKNQPKYRVVIQEEREKLGGKVIEILGVYHPLEEPTRFEIDKEKASAWIKKGAQPTEKVRILLGKAGVMSPIDLAALPKKKKKESGDAPATEAPKAEAPKAEAAPAAKEAA